MFTFEGSVVFLIFQAFACVVIVTSKNCDMALYDPSGSFSSHTSGEYYESNMDCTFTIEVPDGNGVRLTWESFDVKGDMPQCQNQDYVEVFVGCIAQTIGQFCSDNSVFPHDIYSPDKCLKIIFHTNGQDNGKGFTASYESVDLKSAVSSSTGCGRTDLQADSGVIYSPQWPLFYPPTKECTWEITVGSGNQLKISFMEFNLQASSFCGSHDDHVEVRGSEENGYFYTAVMVQDRVCGKRMPFYLSVTHEKVFVRFKSDSFTEARGFIAGYVVYKPGKDNGIFMVTIVIGVLVFLAVMACCIGICCFYRRQSRKRKRRSSAHRAREQSAHQEQQASEQTEPVPRQLNTSIPAPITGPPPPYSLTHQHSFTIQTTNYPSPEYPPMYSGLAATPPHNPAYPLQLEFPPVQSENAPPYPTTGHPAYPLQLEFSPVQSENAPPYRTTGHSFPNLVDPPPYTTLPRPT